MKVKTLSALVGIPLLAAGVVAGAGAANAAVLTGAGEISFGNVVNVDPVLGDPDGPGPQPGGQLVGTKFDFLPDPGEIEVGATTGILGFSGFTGALNPDGSILDIAIKELPILSTTPALPVANFITLDGGLDPDTTYTLESIPLTPTFNFAAGATFVEIKTKGTWYSGNGEVLKGAVSFSATYVGLGGDTPAQTEAIFFQRLTANTLPNINYAAQGQAFENVTVPEPTSAAGALFAMGLGAFSLKRKKQQAK